MLHVLKNLNIKLILLIAIALRIAWAYFVPVFPLSDSTIYDSFARSIATGYGYAFPNGDITAYWPVGTSAIYALLYKLFGFSYTPIVLFNIIIGVSIVGLTFAIALRYLNKKIAIIAASLVAFWPILIEFTTILASELVFIFLILSAIYVWGTKSVPYKLRAIAWGALVCAATYVRPAALPMLIILPLLEWLTNRNLRYCIVSLCFATLTSVILFSPWVYRNYQIFNEFVLVSTNGGVNLWMGNNPNSNGGYIEIKKMDFLNEVERDKYLGHEAIQFILENPLSYLRLVFQRIYITYEKETIGVVWNGYLDKHLNPQLLMILKVVSTLYWWLILILASIGLYCILRDHELKPFHVLIVIPAFFFFFSIVIVGQDRYHMPLNPFLAIFAAYPLYKWSKFTP